jgi:hypothetical protein
MRRKLSSYLFALMTAGLVVFATGCQTLQPTGIETVSLVDHGGGGGDN